MVAFFNGQLERFAESHPSTASKTELTERAKRFVGRNPAEYSWTRGDFARLAAGQRSELTPNTLRTSLYRPFFKQHLAFGPGLNEYTYQLPKLYPTADAENRGICVVSQGSKSPFGVTATDIIPSFHLIGSDATTHFARWRYEEPRTEPSLLDDATDDRWKRFSNLNPAAVHRFQADLGKDITDDDLFHYVYGALHSPEFRERYEANLKKEAPRVPMAPDRATFDAYRDAGAELMELHIGYETVEPYPIEEHWSYGADPEADPRVLRVGDKKMRYPKATDPGSGVKVTDRTQLIYNQHLTLSGIPERAHDYKLGTRSGIDWIIDRYYIKTDKASAIINDPNACADEHDDPRYIVDLIGRVITLSLRTLDIIDCLPSPLSSEPMA